MPVAATDRFHGRVVIVAPHMDDEVLACGGLIAKLAASTDIHIVYATDGMMSPAPVIPWQDSIDSDLGERRMAESKAATALLGVPSDHLHFLALPEARLAEHLPELKRLLLDRLRQLMPDHVIVPFRYDRHPDHLAVNGVVSQALLEGACHAELTEYFVYYRCRLLPRGDIRRYVRSEYLFEIPIDEVARRKRAALACFETQTTRFYPWQTRPILTAELLDEECLGPEVFLRAGPKVRGTDVFTDSRWWIPIAHRLEPRLQKWKYLVKSTVSRGIRSSRHGSG
jgi:LmbE family N-acetylglucosaminyl deacetylase